VSRTAVYSALVLRNRSSGKESNNEVTLLTAEEGIIKATVFGGPKSKLRAHSAPYNSGQVWIYHDSSKEYRKLSDFDVHSWRPGLRDLYDRTMAAGGLAETILSTHGGGGEWGIALELAESTLDALENANEELCPCLLIHFLWRWAGFLGIQPQVDRCSSCGNEAADRPLWFSSLENTVFCENCVSNSVPGLLQLNPGCRRWLAAVSPVDPSNLHRYSMDKKSFNETKTLATAVMAEALGKRLASWDW
jgi:DNA repair protein RecO (recombination protein O)